MSSSTNEVPCLSGAITPVVTTPSSIQIALDLTCALVTNGMFRFRTLDSQGRLDELLQFIAANAAQIPRAMETALSKRVGDA
jgi:hypothetical protein